MCTLLTTSTCPPPDDHAGCDLAVIAIDARDARRLLRRLDALTHLQTDDREAYAWYVWDGQVRFASLRFALEDDDPPWLLGLEEGARPLPPGADLNRWIEIQETACELVIIRRDDVVWLAILRHTDLDVRSEAIPRRGLEAIAQDQLPPEAALRLDEAPQ